MLCWDTILGMISADAMGSGLALGMQYPETL
jgi:hypothetical protein